MPGRVLIASLALGALVATSAPRPAAAQEIVIKLGTLAPAQSPWHNLLKEMGQKWKEASGGKVNLKIYAGGTVGSEGDMVRKMRVGQLQAAALTVVGLHDIASDPQALSAPMAIQSYDELDTVLAKMGPKLEKSMADKGFVVLNWADVGFVRFFSSKPFRTPAEAKGRKIFTWEGDPSSVEAWKSAGFQPVVLSSTDVIPSLQTGMIDTVAASPLYAFTARIFQKANKMLDLRWALLVGATIVKKDDWDKVPADVRPKLIAIAREYAGKIATEVRRMDEDALTQMKKQGLEVVPAGDLDGWRKVAESANGVVRGKVVPAPVFDEVTRLAQEFRAKKK